jgi:hypothetical protein
VSQPPSGIVFAGGGEWGAYSQVEMARLAQAVEVTPLAVRILFAALGRHDRNGHARFRPGELARILGSIDVTTGEIWGARSDVVSKALGTAKRLGYISEESTARCLVVPRTAFQKRHGRVEDCQVHAA